MKVEEGSSENEESLKDKREDTHPCDGDILMIRRTLNNKPSPQLLSQRENIFHTRCKVQESTCSLILGSGSCFNYCSTRLVNKLDLIVIPHLKP